MNCHTINNNNTSQRLAKYLAIFRNLLIDNLIFEQRNIFLGSKDNVITLKKNCIICNVPFECDALLNCWCTEVSKLSKNDIDDRDCMCKNCLLKKYQERLIHK